MTSALSLAEGGFPVHLVEKSAQLGGNLQHVYVSQPTPEPDEQLKNPQQVLRGLVARVNADPNITVYLNSQVISAKGFKGNFASLIQNINGDQVEITHGATILATGAQEYRGPEHGYGTDPRIVTQQEFEQLLTNQPSKIENLKSLVMIQCVGPAERFCSRICCTVALKNALALKSIKPQAQVVILYKDIRTYGFKERLYSAAREHGVLFVRYDEQHTPQVSGSDGTSPLAVLAWDPNLGRNLVIHPDLLVLSMPAVPGPDVKELAALFKVPIDADGFFLEAHVKLRPVDFATEGVFMAGMAHYPKLLDEAMIQAQAAAGRAARLLSQDTLTGGGRVAVVEALKCTGCLTCVRICPFNIPVIHPNLSGVGSVLGAAYIEASICQGCGLCAAECPARAIQLMHYTDIQLSAKVRALVSSEPGFIPLEEVRIDGG